MLTLAKEPLLINKELLYCGIKVLSVNNTAFTKAVTVRGLYLSQHITFGENNILASISCTENIPVNVWLTR